MNTPQPASLDAEYGELRALAEEANKSGKWTLCGPMGAAHLQGHEPWFWLSASDTLHLRVQACPDGFVPGRIEQIAKHMAAANPAAILSILDRNAQLVERVAVLEAALLNIRDYRTDVDAKVAARSMRFYAELVLEDATPHPHADEAAKVEAVHQFNHGKFRGDVMWIDCDESELVNWRALGVEHRTLYRSPSSPAEGKDK